MKKQFAVYWLGSQREIYGVGSYMVLGTTMGHYNTKEEAEEYITQERFKTARAVLTIMEVYINLN